MPTTTKYTDQQQLDRARRELARLQVNLKQMQTHTALVVDPVGLKEYARRAAINCNVLIALADIVQAQMSVDCEENKATEGGMEK